MPDTTNETKILIAAEKEFIQKGYDGARMQKIADEAGINKAMLHYYFRSKEKLFTQVLLVKITEFLPKVGAAFHSENTLVKKIEIFVDSYLGLLADNPRLPMFVLSSIQKNPDFLRHIPNHFIQGIIEYFQLEIDNGNVNPVDPRHFILSIIGMCIFPYIGRPMAQHLLSMTDSEYQVFLESRKPELLKYIHAVLLPARSSNQLTK